MSQLLLSREDSVLFLTLNRPDKRNALNDALIEALKTALNDADTDPSIKAIVISGAGKDFCSGADLSALQKIADSSYEENLEDARELMKLFQIIRRVKVPVIAAVHGRALAGGAGLATACDIVLAAESARFGYPEVKIGFVPAMVMAILRRNLPEKKAFELSTQGFEFSAGEAESYGLVNRVFDDAMFEEEVRKYAAVYEKLSSSAVQFTKQLLYEMDAASFDDALESGAVINAKARMTDDCQNGIRRFLNKD